MKTKLVAKNTIYLFVRQVIFMAVSLITVRIVLEVLGVIDFGIFTVVGGVVTLFSFLTGAMATASQRYFSFDLGRDDHIGLKKTFGVSLSIYICIIVITLIFAETVGLWFINIKLDLPYNRLAATKVLYQTSIISFVATVLAAPYIAMILAHEDMGFYSLISSVDVLLRLGVTIALIQARSDRLVLYGIYLSIAACATTMLYVLLSLRKYSEARTGPVWDKKLFTELFSYTGWNIFGSAVGIFKIQALNIVLNQMFSPIVVAARGITAQVNGAIGSLSQNFSTAIRPQIIKNYAAGDLVKMNKMVIASSKLTYLLVFLFALPLFLEIDFVLAIWLKSPPPFTAIFIRLALLDILIDSFSYPLMTAAQATGKVKLYQSVVGGILLLNLPISFIVLTAGANPESVFLVSIALTFLAFVARLLIIRMLLKFNLKHFILKSIVPVLLCTLFSSVVTFGLSRLLELGWVKLFILSATSSLSIAVSAYFFATSIEERQILNGFFRKFHRKNYA